MQTSFINERINDFLEQEKQCNKEMFAQLCLYIFSLESKENKNDLYLLAKKVSLEELIDLVCYYDGDTIRLPNKEQLNDSFLIAFVMYMKEILEYDWPKIKKILNLPENEKDRLSSISIGRRINNIKEKFNKDINKILNKIDSNDEEIKNIKKKVENGCSNHKNK